MLDNKTGNKEKELVNLISFAYDLHEDGLDYFNCECDLFPRAYLYDDNSYDTKKIDGGIVWGNRGYPDHSSCYVFTTLGLTVDKVVEEKFIFDYAIEFSIRNDEEYVTTHLLECNDNKKYEPELTITFAWYDLDEEKRIELFVKSMVLLGFRECDVKDVIKGKMTAREAYINIAPDDKKYKQWVDFERRHYVFEKNIGISGSFGSIYNIDRFPFPFDGEVIIDCSKAKTSSIKLGENNRKVRLINVNENKNSLTYANIRNAIIDEVIDLSLVDCTWTKFGHHRVKNLENSIANIEDMDLTLACDSRGNKLKFNDNCKISYQNNISNESAEKRSLKVLANVDLEDNIIDALDKGVTGIGLIRTETKFYGTEMIEKYFSLFLDSEGEEDLLKEFMKEEEKTLTILGSNFSDEEFKIRLFDFRFNDIAKSLKLAGCLEENRNVLNFYADFVSELRGAIYLVDNIEILRAQIKAIFNTSKKLNRNVDIIIPYIENIWYLEEIKNIISEISKDYDVDYRIGAMIENRNSAYIADKIAKEVDFISLGLNDLTESITGKSRETRSDEFYYLCDDVKEVLKETIYRARCGNENIEIGICGEHTNMIENIEFFNNLDVNYISVNPVNINTLKDYLNKSDRKKYYKKSV